MDFYPFDYAPIFENVEGAYSFGSFTHLFVWHTLRRDLEILYVESLWKISTSIFSVEQAIPELCLFLTDITETCLFVLRYYGPVNPMGSCRVRSVYLTTRLLGRLSPLSGESVLCTFFRQKLTCPSWISGRERMTVENISWSTPQKNVADLGGGWTRDLLVSTRTAHPTEPRCRLQKLVWEISWKVFIQELWKLVW